MFASIIDLRAPQTPNFRLLANKVRHCKGYGDSRRRRSHFSIAEVLVAQSAGTGSRCCTMVRKSLAWISVREPPGQSRALGQVSRVIDGGATSHPDSSPTRWGYACFRSRLAADVRTALAVRPQVIGGAIAICGRTLSQPKKSSRTSVQAFTDRRRPR